MRRSWTKRRPSWRAATPTRKPQTPPSLGWGLCFCPFRSWASCWASLPRPSRTSSWPATSEYVPQRRRCRASACSHHGVYSVLPRGRAQSNLDVELPGGHDVAGHPARFNTLATLYPSSHASGHFSGAHHHPAVQVHVHAPSTHRV